MTDRELHKLRRGQLMELVRSEINENETLRARIEALESELNDRTLKVENAGSIAEASLTVLGVFETAQHAADGYLENLRRLESESEQLKTDSAEEAGRILTEAKTEAEEIVMKAKAEAEAIVAAAESESAAYWQKVSSRIDSLCDEREGLRELLRMIAGKAE